MSSKSIPVSSQDWLSHFNSSQQIQLPKDLTGQPSSSVLIFLKANKCLMMFALLWMKIKEKQLTFSMDRPNKSVFVYKFERNCINMIEKLCRSGYDIVSWLSCNLMWIILMIHDLIYFGSLFCGTSCLWLTHWGWDKMAINSLTFSNAFLEWTYIHFD